MRVIKIKNIDTVLHTWGNRDYPVSDEYTIEDQKDLNYYLNMVDLTGSNPFFADVLSGKAQISNDLGILSPADGLKHLIKEEIVTVELPAFANKTLPSGEKLFRRKFGYALTVAGSGTNELKILVPFKCKFDKIELLAGELGDSADLTIYAPDQTTSLNVFGSDVYIAEGYYEDDSKYDAELIAGLYVGVRYHNSSVSEKTIYINIVLHEMVTP